jgi:hypothetical protein
MEISQADGIESREDLRGFTVAPRDDLLQNPGTWENPTLEGFLSALAAWTTDMDGYFRNRGQQVPEQPTWSLLGKMLCASKVYE